MQPEARLRSAPTARATVGVQDAAAATCDESIRLALPEIHAHLCEPVSPLASLPRVVRFARPIPPSPVGVVITDASEQEVLWGDARWIVAGMADDNSRWYRSLVHVSGEAMPQILHGSVGDPVAVGVSMPVPLETPRLSACRRSAPRQALRRRQIGGRLAQRPVRLAVPPPSAVMTLAVAPGVHGTLAATHVACIHGVKDMVG